MPGQVRCDEPNDWLPIVICTLSVLLTVMSIPLNGVVLVSIVQNKKFHSIFYYIIFNSTAADFLIGAILCPLSIAIHVQEIRDRPMNEHVNTAFHFGLFVLAMVSVLSITVLSVDRMISLKFSTQYRVMRKRNFLATLLAVWVVAASLSPIYFFIEYSLFLTVISVSAVLVTAAMMFVTYMFYRAQLRRTFIRSHSSAPKDPSDQKTEEGPGAIHHVSEIEIRKHTSIPTSIKRKLRRSKKDSVASISSAQKMDEDYQVYLMEKRATNTFFCILIVFFLCYVPVVVISITIYTHRNSYRCYTSNLLEESIAILCIVSSVCKTIVFLCRLTTLRKACLNLFISDEAIERKWQKESIAMVPKKKKKKKKTLLKERLLRRQKSMDDENSEVFL